MELPTGFLGLSLNDRTIPFQVILLDLITTLALRLGSAVEEVVAQGDLEGSHQEDMNH